MTWVTLRTELDLVGAEPFLSRTSKGKAADRSGSAGYLERLKTHGKP